MRKQRLHYSPVLLLTSLAIFGLVTTFFLVATDQKAPDSYDECISAKGSVILDSYPSICMTKQKQRFVNPHEKVEPISRYN